MTALYEATKQALAFTMRDFASLRDFEAAKAVLQDSIRSALVEEEKAAAWLTERKEHWRKEKEKIQATDPELSAALGWPGGISDPVLDRTRLLQMVAALMQDKLWEDHRVRHLWDQSQEQAEPVTVDAAYQRWLADTHAPALRRMDSQGAFSAGWQAALAQQAEPVQQVKTCAWRDNLDAIYETECGNLHIVNDGTLEENGMKYCYYCGKEIKDESPT